MLTIVLYIPVWETFSQEWVDENQWLWQKYRVLVVSNSAYDLNFELPSQIIYQHLSREFGIRDALRSVLEHIQSDRFLLLQQSMQITVKLLERMLFESQQYTVVSANSKQYCNDHCILFHINIFAQISQYMEPLLTLGYGIYLTELLRKARMPFYIVRIGSYQYDLKLSQYVMQQMSNILACVLGETKSTIIVEEEWYTPIRDRVSIVVLIWNNLKVSMECIQSILTMTKHPYELILVDNGSSESVEKILKKKLRKNKHIKVIRNDINQGFPQGCNDGMKHATGDHILLLNNDTLLTPFWLTRMVAGFTFPDTGIVGPMSINISGFQNINSTDVPYNDSRELCDFSNHFALQNLGIFPRVDLITGFAMLIRKEVWEKIGGMDPVFGFGNCEDADYCARAKRAGFIINLCNDIFIHHIGSVSFQELEVEVDNLIVYNQVYSHFHHFEHQKALDFIEEARFSFKKNEEGKKLWFTEGRLEFEKSDYIRFEIRDCLLNFQNIQYPFPKEQTVLAIFPTNEDDWARKIKDILDSGWNCIIRIEPPVPFLQQQIQEVLHREISSDQMSQIFLDCDYVPTIERGVIYDRVCALYHFQRIDFFRFEREAQVLNLPIKKE